MFIYVIMGKCKGTNCDQKAKYNKLGEEPMFCSKCKTNTMIVLRKTVCMNDECNKVPSFNYKGESKSLYCSKHKLPNMIDVKSKTCINIDCDLIASYNYKCESKRLYCNIHKLENMVNLKKILCLHDGCNKSSNFGYEHDHKQLYCSEHKLINMINLTFKPCIYSGCKKHPCFNFENENKPIYCYNHKLDNMINIKLIKCKTPMCSITANSKYKGYCLSCFIHLFPDEPNTLNYKTIEKHITDYIKEKLSDLDWIVDCKVYDGCSRRRPDIFLDLGYQVLVVEIDENQHTDYDCSCENKRLMEISKDINHRPLIFIRFNPDKYMNGEIKIASCWSLNKQGICTISKKKEWNERLNNLETQIR